MKRKIFISISFLIVIICCFNSNFISHAEDLVRPPDVNGVSYTYFDEFLEDLGISFSPDQEYLKEYFDTYYEDDDVPDDLVLPLSDSSIDYMFDHDFSVQGEELLVREDLANKNVTRYVAIRNSNNQITGWNTETIPLSNCGFDYYALFYNSLNSKYTLYLFDDDQITLTAYNNQGHKFNGFSVSPTSEPARLFNFYSITSSGDNWLLNSSGNSLINPDENYYNNVSSPDFLLTYSLGSILNYSNILSYTTSPLERTGSSNGSQRVYFSDGSNYVSEIYGSPNYLIPNKGDVSGSDSSDIYPDGSGGAPANNMYLNQPDWTFKHKDYVAPYSKVINTMDPIPNGTVTFSAIPNDFQVDYADAFTVNFNFTFKYNVTYQNTGDPFSVFGHTGTILNTKKDLKLNFKSTDFQVPLSDFISNGNSKTFTFKELFDNLSTNDTDLSNVMQQMKELDSASYNEFNLYCNAWLSADGQTSDKYTEYYNPISKKGLTTDTGLSNNNNPYYPSASDQAAEDPTPVTTVTPYVPGPAGTSDSSGTSSSNATANPNIVINNNPNINNTNENNNNANGDLATSEGGLFSDGVIPAILKLLFVEKDDTVDTIQEYVDSNSWFSVIQSTWSWIPTQIWDVLTVFFVACLGILVTAFIISLVLKFIT